MLPVGLVLLLLTGIGPLLAWRKSTIANMAHQFLWPVLAASVTAMALVVSGVRVWASGICFALCAWVLTTIVQEFVRGAGVRKQTTGTDLFTALVGLFGRSRRRYAGYVVHLGIVLMFFGFAGEGFKNEADVNLTPGQQVTVGAFTVRHDALRVSADAQKQMITGHVTVTENGTSLGTMTPAKWFFEKRQNEPPTTEVAIRRAIGEDLYIVLAGFEVADQSAFYKITVNPLVNWVWLGLGIMVVGCILAMLPESAFAVAVAKLPEGAATTTMLMLALLMPVSLRADGQEAQNASVNPKSALFNSLEGEIMCTCGGCRRPMNDCPMEPNCHGLGEQRAKLTKFLEQGMDRDAVLAAFVADHGSQEILARPIDKGFNRLLWMFPYLLGGTALVGVALLARRWSAHDESTAPATAVAAEDQALNERLNDELRDLD
jgi:cytochrome c-type biogenesis protein CcmF